MMFVYVLLYRDFWRVLGGFMVGFGGVWRGYVKNNPAPFGCGAGLLAASANAL